MPSPTYELLVLIDRGSSGRGVQAEEVKEALNKAREAGIQNILALRGDPAKGE